MILRSIFFICLLFNSALLHAQIVEKYVADSASVEHTGVPKGELIKCSFKNSNLFPGTYRDYWIYVPKQYDASKPACVYVGQDGVMYNAPIVFDNLINSGEMPITIGVFISPGKVLSLNPEKSLDRYNRSFEYDGLGDNYVRFLLEEIFPDAEKHTATDGRKIWLSKNGNDRCIAGNSSGAIAAFTAAWERPEEFSKVFTSVGTFVGLRGGNEYSTLIRKYEPKPIKIFMQDGSNDNNIYAGDWWKANEMMERSLTFSGYEVEHVWGEGSHNAKQATAIFPDGMRWLWRNYPEKVKVGVSKNQALAAILIPGEDWEIAKNSDEVIKSIIKTNNSKELFIKDNKLLQNYRPPTKTLSSSLIKPNRIALTPDQSQVYVADPNSRWIYIYQILDNGVLANKQKYGWLHLPDDEQSSEASSIVCDTDGRVYVATNLGIQILDQIGRVNAILTLPIGKASSLYFGGKDRNILYAVSNGKVFGRKLNSIGVAIFGESVLPTKPKL